MLFASRLRKIPVLDIRMTAENKTEKAGKNCGDDFDEAFNWSA